MKYIDFSATDFAADEYFQSWIFNPEDESIRNYWALWLADNPGKRDEVMEARRILESIRFSHYTLATEDLTQLWNRIHSVENTSASKKTPAIKNWYKFTAAALILVSISHAFYWSGSKPWKEYQTNYGETATLVLPDGSSVVLNANSKLTLLSEWKDDVSREIWLDGEAFFSVEHKANNQSFKVNTKEGVTVEVLGTTFNVYNRTNETKVVLNSGQIRLNLPIEDSPKKIMMKPGDMVEYKEKRYKKREVDPKLYSAWTSNKIILDRTSLGEMVNMLKDNYGLEVKVDDSSLLNETVSGSMPLGDAKILLEQMASAFQLRIKSENNIILIEELSPVPNK